MKTYSFPTQPHKSRSEKYSLIDTNEVIALFQEHGYEVDKIRRGKKGVSSLYGNHVVTMTHKDLPRSEEGFFNIIFQNSYDGSARFSMSVGFFRLVCENGLMIGTGLKTGARKHIKINKEDLFREMDEMVASVTKHQLTIKKAKSIPVTAVMYKSEIEPVLEEIIGKRTKKKVDVTNLVLNRRRNEDQGSDLWTVLNVIQENLLRGTSLTNLVTGKEVRIRSVENNPSRFMEVNKVISTLLDKLTA